MVLGRFTFRATTLEENERPTANSLSSERVDRMGSVLQEWTEFLSLKKQTVLLGAIRSPDTIFTLKLKQVTVWIRTQVLRNADPMTGFMHAALQELPLFEQIDREFERMPLHAAHHILLAMQVLGIEHPDQSVRTTARGWYHDAVKSQHLNPETDEEYQSRMTDNLLRIEEGTS